MSEPLLDPEVEPYMILGQELIRHVYSGETPEEINGWCQSRLQMLAGAKEEGVRLTWEESFAFYDELMAKREAKSLLPESERRELTWPWASWNKYLDPLEPGMLALIAAGDGVGKTAAAECLAEHWARQGFSVAFLHFELNKAIMMDRRAARHTGITRRELKGGRLTTTQKTERARADDVLRTWRGKITYVHTPGWTVERSMAEVRALIAESLCDVFIVDYLEKASASARQLKQYGANHFEREANDVELIKSFSEATETSVVLLAQLNKLGKGQRFEDLTRTDIQGSGSKSNKANVVALLHRDTPESQRIRVRLDKNTIGPPGSFEQWMDAPRFRMTDMEEPVQPQPSYSF